AAQGFATRDHAPRVRIQLSPKLWLGSFLVTSSIYLIQVDAEGISAGRWPLLAPWLHTAALPAFAVLSVVVALIYRAVENWLSDYESYARETVARASRSAAGPLTALGGIVWALVQPYRITLLHPRGETFWFLVVEPPLLVIAVALFFHFVIAPGLLEDLEDLEEKHAAAG